MIKTQKEYLEKLTQLERIMMDIKKEYRVEKVTAFDELTLEIHEYESENIHIGLPSLKDAVSFRLEQLGWDEARLAKETNSVSEARNIMEGNFETVLVTTLAETLGVPAKILCQRFKIWGKDEK